MGLGSLKRVLQGPRICYCALLIFPPTQSQINAMSLDVDAVNRIAFLARLQITEEQVSGFASNLSNILEFVEQMDAIDTAGVAPMAHPQDVTQRLRADTVTEENQRELFQQLSPAVEKGLFLVPKVIE